MSPYFYSVHNLSIQVNSLQDDKGRLGTIEENIKKLWILDTVLYTKATKYAPPPPSQRRTTKTAIPESKFWFLCRVPHYIFFF